MVASKHQFLKANFQSDLTRTCLPAFALVMYFMSGRARNVANFVVFVMATSKLLSYCGMDIFIFNVQKCASDPIEI